MQIYVAVKRTVVVSYLKEHRLLIDLAGYPDTVLVKPDIRPGWIGTGYETFLLAWKLRAY